jgi:2-methylcitrate dehydratase PrpD
MTAVNTMGAWVAGCSKEWPEDALNNARRAFIDTIGVMLPGANEPVYKKIVSLVQGYGSGSSTLFLCDQKTFAPWAALAGGTAAHALDFDDNFDPAKAHASAVLVPTILALGEDVGATFGDALDAYIVGLQIMGKTGQGINPFHRSRGWHATATIGAIGAAAAAARLLQLNSIEAAHAISLSTSTAGGFMSQFGTMAKPVHAGLAAMGGVLAATMAAQGITAGADTLDGPKGMGTLMVGPDVEQLRLEMQGTAEHGQTMQFDSTNIGLPLHISEYGLKTKRFPNCGSVHRALDGLLALREDYQFSPDNVAQIVVRAPESHLNNLMHRQPQDGLQAKFSLEYNLAVGLIYGNVTLADYVDPAVLRPDVQLQMKKIIRDPVDQLESEFDTEVHITLGDGSVVSTSIHMPLGSKNTPMSDEQLWSKFDACVLSILTKEKTKMLRESLKYINNNVLVSSIAGLCS